VVRARRLVIVSLAAALAVSTLAVGPFALCHAQVAPPPTVKAPASAPVPVPIDRQSYRIRVLLSSSPGARVDGRRRETLVADWMTLVRRFVGSPWVVEVADESASASPAAGLESLTADDLAAFTKEVEKVWVIRVDAQGSGLTFSGRELDVTTGRLGPLQRRVAPVMRDAARVFLQFAFDLFAPYAEIGERFGKDVSLTVRGASVQAASPLGQVAPKGTIFLPLRVVPVKEGKPLVREIPFTFLRVEAAQDAGARCSVVSVYSDPFTRRVVQKTSLIALGVRPGKSLTRLRFQTVPDKAPAAGYVLTARNFPDGVPREIGTTDREGRVTFDPTAFDGLVMLRLLAGSTEPMIEFPYMPGDTGEERTIPPFDPKPLAVALETKLDALRDEVIDLVAVRARLQSRLKARFDSEDWAGAAEGVTEFRKLPPRDKFADELKRLHDEARQRQAAAKAPVLTKTAQAQIADVQALIDRYLDDEAFKSYADALDRMKTSPPAAPKAATKPANAAK
jgi:hypothetical protein